MIELIPVLGLAEVEPGADIAGLVAGATALRDGDVVVVCQKIVSKAEGALVPIPDDEPPEAARRRVATGEAVRVVADEPHVLIVETRHGFVCANAGVDASNVPAGLVALLPEDPDRSARLLRARLRQLTGADVGVVVSDTFGRPWRIGQTDVAIGVAGLPPIRDERGGQDRFGQVLTVTEVAVADEVAAAADLVRRKADGVPVVVVRGLDWEIDESATAHRLVRPAAEDLFPRARGSLADRLGRRSAAAGSGPLGPPRPAVVDRAAAAARRVAGGGVTVSPCTLGWEVTAPTPAAAGAAAAGLAAALHDLGHPADVQLDPDPGAPRARVRLAEPAPAGRR